MKMTGLTTHLLKNVFPDKRGLHVVLLLMLFVGSAIGTARAAGEIRLVHEERSLYRNILITEDDDRRCMRFMLHAKATHNQSCMYLDNDQELVFEYTRMTVAAAISHEAPKRILIIGLGGGSLPRAFNRLWPEAEIMSVEIDVAVVKAAQKWFGYSENSRIKTGIADARVFVKRALKNKQQWDLVVLDAFNGDYIPEHLLTREFLEEVRGVLAPGGKVIANTFSTSKLYHHESTTYAAVFPELKMLRAEGGNRVLIASMTPIALPLNAERHAYWQPLLKPLGVDLDRVQALLKPADWDRNARVLTDQFSPANILKHE